MTHTRRFGMVALVALLGLFISHAAVMAQAKANPISTVTFEELGKEVRKHRGKVVVVDCWFVGCVPCYHCMQHLVKMQDKHAEEGMVAITVCVNITDVDWTTYESDANKILNKLSITANNRLLKLSFEDAAEKMQLPGGFPTVFVFDRKGLWRQFSSEAIQNDMDPWILRCLREK